MKGSLINILRAFSWNSIGSAIFLGFRWLTTIIIANAAIDFTDAGNYAFAMNLANVFVVFSTYSLRDYQVSDYKNKYSDGIYFSTRLLTSVVTYLFFVLYSLIFISSDIQKNIVLIYMTMILIESIIDVLHGINQKKWRLDVNGKSFILRGILSLISFIAFYKYFDLNIAIASMSLISLIILFFFDLKATNKISSFKIVFDFKEIFSLLKTGFPLVVITLMHIIITSYPRILLNNIASTSLLGIYASITTLTVVIQMAAGFIFSPLINTLTQLYNEKKYKKFNKLVILILLIFIVLSLFTALLIYYVGEDLLALIFDKDIVLYTNLFIESVCVTGLLIITLLMRIVLTIMRQIKGIFICYAITTILCIPFTGFFIEKFSLSGANYIQALAFIISFISLLLLYRFKFVAQLNTDTTLCE